MSATKIESITLCRRNGVQEVTLSFKGQDGVLILSTNCEELQDLRKHTLCVSTHEGAEVCSVCGHTDVDVLTSTPDDYGQATLPGFLTRRFL